MQALKTDRPETLPDTTFMSASAFARVVGIPVNQILEACRRTIDPIPHLKFGEKGRTYYIEIDPAIAWLRRKFGAGYLRPKGVRK